MGYISPVLWLMPPSKNFKTFAYCFSSKFDMELQVVVFAQVCLVGYWELGRCYSTLIELNISLVLIERPVWINRVTDKWGFTNEELIQKFWDARRSKKKENSVLHMGISCSVTNVEIRFAHLSTVYMHALAVYKVFTGICNLVVQMSWLISCKQWHCTCGLILFMQSR